MSLAVHLPEALKHLNAGEVEVGAIAIGGLFLAGGLVRAVGRVARAAAAVATVAATPAKAARGGFKPLAGLLALGVAGFGGAWGWNHIRHGATGAPAPTPSTFSPSPKPTVTVTAKPSPASHFNVPHLAIFSHLTGTDWVLIVLIGSVAAVAIAGSLLRRPS